MVQFELVNWARRVEPETQRFEDLVAFTKTCVIVPLSTEIAVDAAGLSLDHGLAAADAIIYATATSLDADLLTCDAHFERLPRVVYIPKQAN
jgi:predicted nucleic acid-binding protein